MDKQRGGAFRVSGYIALALLALAVAEAGYIRHLFAHRVYVIQPNCPVSDIQLPGTEIHGNHDPANDDAYVTHTFPANRQVCSSFDTICWTRI